MNNKKKFKFIGIIAIVILAILLSLIISHIIKENTPVIVKKNVKVITNESLNNDILFVMENHSLVYSLEQDYEIGDVLVAGITDISPNGFIRKVTGIDSSYGSFTYYTEPATLIDVFEKAHIVKQFRFIDGELIEINEENTNNITGMSLESNEAATIKSLVYQNCPEILQLSKNSPFLKIEKELNFKNKFDVNINAEFDLWLELQIDIEDDNIVFGVTAHNAANGNINIAKNEEYKLSDNVSLPILLKEFDVPNMQFYMAGVPVVITNDLRLYVDGEIKIGGNLSTDISLDSERIVGFEYDSKVEEIREINEKNYLSDGIKWDTEIGAYGNSEVLLDLHLITKLYGSTGADLSIGISGGIDGEVSAETSDTGGLEVCGKLDMNISPKTTGKVIVEVPVIDYRLAEATLFEKTLSPLWQYTWENKVDLLIGCRDERFLIYEGDGLRVYALIDKENPIDVSLYGINYSGKDYSCVVAFVSYDNKFAMGHFKNNIAKENKRFCIMSPNSWIENDEYRRISKDANLSFTFGLYGNDESDFGSFADNYEYTIEEINSQILTKYDIDKKYNISSITTEESELYMRTSLPEFLGLEMKSI